MEELKLEVPAPAPAQDPASLTTLEAWQPLWAQFRSLPYQAVTAKLANVLPAGGDWLPEDTVWFNTRTEQKQFVSLIKSIEAGGEPVVELVLVDTTHPSEDKYIDQELVQVTRNDTVNSI